MYLKVVGKLQGRSNEQTQMIECKDYHISRCMHRIYIDSLTQPGDWKTDIGIWKYDSVEIFTMNANGKTIDHFIWYKSEAEKMTADDNKKVA